MTPAEAVTDLQALVDTLPQALREALAILSVAVEREARLADLQQQAAGLDAELTENRAACDREIAERHAAADAQTWEKLAALAEAEHKLAGVETAYAEKDRLALEEFEKKQAERQAILDGLDAQIGARREELAGLQGGVATKREELAELEAAIDAVRVRPRGRVVETPA